jgi:hypothetical protein
MSLLKRAKCSLDGYFFHYHNMFSMFFGIICNINVFLFNFASILVVFAALKVATFPASAAHFESSLTSVFNFK